MAPNRGKKNFGVDFSFKLARTILNGTERAQCCVWVSVFHSASLSKLVFKTQTFQENSTAVTALRTVTWSAPPLCLRRCCPHPLSQSVSQLGSFVPRCTVQRHGLHSLTANFLTGRFTSLHRLILLPTDFRSSLSQLRKPVWGGRAEGREWGKEESKKQVGTFFRGPVIFYLISPELLDYKSKVCQRKTEDNNTHRSCTFQPPQGKGPSWGKAGNFLWPTLLSFQGLCLPVDSVGELKLGFRQQCFGAQVHGVSFVTLPPRLIQQGKLWYQHK